MVVLYEGEYEFDGMAGQRGNCGLAVIRHNDFGLIIATELTNNLGPNVSDWAGPLARQISRQFDIDPESLIFVASERYREYEPDSFLPSDSFALVGMKLDPIRRRFEHFSSPQKIMNLRYKTIALLREGILPPEILGLLVQQ